MPRATQQGLEFGPNSTGKLYVSMYNHRGTGNRNKTIWHKGFSPQEESDLFDAGDLGGWHCAGGNQWGIADDGARRLGSEGERLSFCPSNTNPTVPWHGYPVFGEDDYEVPEKVIAHWLESKVIGGITATRLRRGAL